MSSRERPKYNMWQCVAFMVRTAWGYRKSVLVVCLIAVAVEIGLNLAGLFIAPRILEKVEQGAPLGELFLTIGGFTTALFLLRAARGYVEGNRMPAQIDVRTSIVQRITQKACTTSYPNTRDPEVLKLQEKAEEATSSNSDPTEHVWQTLTALLTSIVGFIIYLSLLSNLDIILLAVTVVTAVVSALVNRYVNEWSYRHREEQEKYLKEINYFIPMARDIKAAKDIRIFGLAGWLREMYGKALSLYASFIRRSERAGLWGDGTDAVMTLARNGVSYACLISMALAQDMPASEFLLYFSAVSGFTGWITGIMDQFSVLHKESIGLSRVLEYLNIPEQFRFEGGADVPRAEGYELRLEDVTFRYPGTEKNIFEHIDLTIHPGEKLAVVGLNGAGKTTLVKLLCGFYDPDEGRVLLNGRDIREFDRRKYYAMFSAVFQDFSILDVTVAENVAQTTEDIDLERVWDCIGKAGLTEQIEKFPMGLDTHVGRNVYLDGVLFSGGQTQRLILARALYKDGPLLVLDEPTAALDPIAENDIYMKYNEMTAGKTSVFISHRLASTRFCDRIIFVADGAIVEEGNHEELLQRGGEYARLFEVQSRYYREGRDYDEEN